MSDALLDLQLELVENHQLLLDLADDDVDALWSPKPTLSTTEVLALPSLELVRSSAQSASLTR